MLLHPTDLHLGFPLGLGLHKVNSSPSEEIPSHREQQVEITGGQLLNPAQEPERISTITTAATYFNYVKSPTCASSIFDSI